jgi:hypothetical protein
MMSLPPALAFKGIHYAAARRVRRLCHDALKVVCGDSKGHGFGGVGQFENLA